MEFSAVNSKECEEPPPDLLRKESKKDDLTSKVADTDEPGKKSGEVTVNYFVSAVYPVLRVNEEVIKPVFIDHIFMSSFWEEDPFAYLIRVAKSSANLSIYLLS